VATTDRDAGALCLTEEIDAAWGVKERLRMLLAEHEPSKMRRRLADFYDAAIDAQMPEATRLAGTVENLVARRVGRPHPRRDQRPHRRVQPDHQAGQTGRLRIQEHDQLQTPYPQPHRGHPTAEISSMNGSHPAQVVEPDREAPEFAVRCFGDALRCGECATAARWIRRRTRVHRIIAARRGEHPASVMAARQISS
jgi:hypothetical protein